MKKKRKLKKRNFTLLIISLIIFLCLLLEMGYTFWIFSGGPLIPSSDEIKKCFKEKHRLLSDCMYSIANSSESLIKSEDNNLRYIGSSPNNYLDLGEKYQSIVYRGFSLTNESDYKDFDNMSDCLDENRKCVLQYHENDPILWRIIGVINIDGLSYVKIIREDSIGKYVWDTSTNDINNGYGINEYGVSKVNDLLNNLFYNQSSGNCFINKDKESSCSFINNGLSKEVKKYLYEAPWYLGSINDREINSLSNIDWYNKELGNNEKLCEKGEYCTDEVERTNCYNAYIGLMYPSDFLLINSCASCSKNSWLVNDKNTFWTISPSSSTNSNSYAIMYSKDNGFEATFTSSGADIYPVAYLKREVKIMGGFGTKEKPYLIH